MVSSNRVTSARLKVDRAKEHVTEINKLLRECRPFRCVYTVNAKTGERAIGPERDEAIAKRVGIPCGDAVHCLHTALDNAYSAVVEPHVRGSPDRVIRSIQFPFSETEERLYEAIRNRHAHKAGPQFERLMLTLRPHGEPRGNKLLYLIYAMDTTDKHTDLIPVADYVNLSATQLRNHVPDFPPGITFENNVVANAFGRWISWPGHAFTMDEWVRNRTPVSGILKTYIDHPTDIVFSHPSITDIGSVVPTLHQLVDVTENVVGRVERFH